MTLRVLAPKDALEVATASAAQMDGDLATNSEGPIRIALVRLAASRVCPARRELLVGATRTALQGLLPEDPTPADIDGDIDRLISLGDLLVGLDVSVDVPRQLVYLAPPMYVRRREGTVFMIGGVQEAPNPFSAVTVTRGHLRELRPGPSDESLVDAGFSAYPMDAWMESPEATEPSELWAKLNALLDDAGNAGALLEVEYLDPNSNPNFYGSRWVAPRRQTGRFLARRRNRWGGRIWGYAEAVRGETTKFHTFPSVDRRFRGCDETWWATFALDALAGNPQQISVLSSGDVATFGFKMPIPMWAERRLLAVGSGAAVRPTGCLTAFDLPFKDAGEELDFLVERLWVQPSTEGVGAS